MPISVISANSAQKPIKMFNLHIFKSPNLAPALLQCSKQEKTNTELVQNRPELIRHFERTFTTKILPPYPLDVIF